MADKPSDESQTETESTKEEGQPQIRGKLLSAEESHDWGTELTIVEKDPKTEENALRNEFEDAAKGEESESSESSESETTEEEEQPEETPVEQQSEQVTIEDPGDFQPGDYTFEITTYDEEGKKPKTVKITTIEQWDELLESDPNLGSTAAVGKAFRAAQKMELNTERDRQAWEDAKATYDQAVKDQEVVETRNTTIFNEINYLIDRQDLPKLTQEEMNNLNWDDPSVVKAHPNIVPHKELLNYMRSENASRLKRGLSPLQSAVDAYNAMQLDERRKGDAEARKAAGEARKAAGARVASGTSTPISTAQPRGIAVGRVGDISRLGTNWNV